MSPIPWQLEEKYDSVQGILKCSLCRMSISFGGEGGHGGWLFDDDSVEAHICMPEGRQSVGDIVVRVRVDKEAEKESDSPVIHLYRVERQGKRTMFDD